MHTIQSFANSQYKLKIVLGAVSLVLDANANGIPLPCYGISVRDPIFCGSDRFVRDRISDIWRTLVAN